MLVTPMEPVIFSGPQSGSFYPTFVQYHLSTTSGTIKYTINVPAWLTVPLRSDTTDAAGRTVTVLLNADAARRLPPGNYRGGVGFINLTNGKVDRQTRHADRQTERPIALKQAAAQIALRLLPPHARSIKSGLAG